MRHFISLILLSTILTILYVNLREKQLPAQFLKEFGDFKQKFSRIYQSQSDQIYRLSIFTRNYLNIKAHNSNPKSTYLTGINQFSDLTISQFHLTYLTLKVQSNYLRIQTNQITQKIQQSTIQADGQINWFEKGFVTNVKNQGQCGACWAFAAVGPVEALNKIKGQSLVSFSAQQLMDCSTAYGNNGCSGGFMVNSYKYIKDKGIITEDKYPYKGVYQKCAINGGDFKVKGFVEIKDCTNLARQLMNIPIAVAIDATKFYNYKSGIFTCDSTFNLNHAFTLVGMTKDYWLGKDSWGTTWGQNGYIRIAKTGSACGICTLASYPIPV